MTAPTPEIVEIAHQFLRFSVISGSPVSFNPPDLRALLDHVAAVTAERDQERAQHEATKSTLDKAWDELHQARQMLADAEKKIASMELDESLREEDERFADPL